MNDLETWAANPQGTGTLCIQERDVRCQYAFIETVNEANDFSIECSIEVSFGLRFVSSLPQTVEFKLDYPECLIQCIPLSTRFNSGMAYLRLTPSRTPLQITEQSRISKVTTFLINFSGYHYASPLVLEGDGWIVSLNRTDEQLSGFPYVVTHALSLQREHDETFSTAEAISMMYWIALFLSFCHDHWVAPRFTRGFSSDGKLQFIEFGSRKISPSRDPDGWLDSYHPQSMRDAFPGFLRAMNNPDLEDTIHQSIYWYIRADTNHTGPDGGIILAQAALERIAWSVLKSGQNAPSKSKLDALKAAGRLRCLLQKLSIPLSIPSGLGDLRLKSAQHGWKDAPQAFTEIRNNLIHPADKFAKDKLPYYEAYVLGKWWIELALLRVFSYEGLYSNRTNRVWVGTVEPVPWMNVP